MTKLHEIDHPEKKLDKNVVFAQYTYVCPHTRLFWGFDDFQFTPHWNDDLKKIIEPDELTNNSSKLMSLVCKITIFKICQWPVWKIQPSQHQFYRCYKICNIYKIGAG